MYARLIKIDPNSKNSFFLFGPRGTGKTLWIKNYFPKGLYIDLLKSSNYNELLADPSRLETYIPPGFKDWIIIDKIQKIPALLDEVHRLITDQNYKFALTGSSARKLKKQGVNLLAGRALNYYMHPFTIQELKNDFSLSKALNFGLLPGITNNIDPEHFLKHI